MNTRESIEELYSVDLDTKTHRSAYRLLRAGVSLAAVGIAATLAGAVADVAGLKSGNEIVLAGIAVDNLGALALFGAVAVGLASGENSEPNEP